MLLQLVSAENHQSLRPVVAQHDLHKLLPERSRSAGYQYRFLRPIDHSYSLGSSAVELYDQPVKRAEALMLRIGYRISDTGLSGYRLSDTANSSKPHAPSGTWL